MARIFLNTFLILFCGFTNHLQAQILSVAPGTDLNVKSGTDFVADRVDIKLFDDFTLTNNTLYVDLIPNTIMGFTTMQRLYKFTNTVSYLQGLLTINYLERELNGMVESDLKFLYNNGTSWVADNGSLNNTANNIITGGALSILKLDAFTAGNFLISGDVIVVKAFPNPSPREFNLMVMTSVQDEIELVVFDSRSVQVGKVQLRPYETIRIGQNLPGGNYVLKAMQGSKRIASIKVVKL